MDDSPKPGVPQSNIDDLVKELSRPQNPLPQASSQPVNTSPPVPASVPKPNTTPVMPATPPGPSLPKEYQSSIRTMSDDLAKLKAGQQPQGVNIPRKIDSTLSPLPPFQPKVSPSPAEKPPLTSATLPPVAKSAPLSTASQAPKPVLPQPQNTIPRPTPPPSVAIPPPVKSPEIKSDQKNQFYVPPAGPAPSSKRTPLIISAVVLMVLLGGAYWYFMIRDSGTNTVVETPVVTFTPRPTATPNADILGAIFPNRGGTIVLPSSGDPSVAFNNALSTQPNVTPGTFTAIDVAGGGVSSTSAQILTITSLLDRFIASYPPELKSVLGQNYKILVYGQKESFDAKGRPTTSTASPRLVIVSEIADSASPILKNWEMSMAGGLKGVFGNAKATDSPVPFMEIIYKGTTVRFRNFPYPDHSIDYALLPYGGKTYLILAGSREAMFATLDSFSTSSVLGK